MRDYREGHYGDWMPFGIFYIRKDGLIVGCNEVVAHWMQYSKAELVGHKQWTDLLSAGGKIYNQTHFMPLLSMGHWVEEVYFDFKKKDGQKLMAYVNARELPEEARVGEAHYCISVFRSTQRARYEEELLKSKRDLETSLMQLQQTQEELVQTSKMALLGQMVGGLAHEINNPLNYILGGVNVIESDLAFVLETFEKAESLAKMPENALRSLQQHLEEANQAFNRPELDNMLKSIKEGVRRISNIVKALLLCMPQYILQKQELSVNMLLEATWQMAGGLARHLKVSMRLEATTPIEGLASELSQAFLNIMLNATEHTAAGGHLSVCSRDVEGGVEVEFADTGVGIPEANIPKIFDPFFTTKPVGKGLGMGLPIVYGIIATHKGLVSVDSVWGHGTKVTIFLPKAEEVGSI